MTNNEFKAWFEGYTEEMKIPPNKTQWKKIQAKVKEIDGNPIWHYYQPYWNQWTYTSTPHQVLCGDSTSDFTHSSSNTMYMAGKTDFNNESASQLS